VLTATALVVANMVGTGVFTSLGYQVGPLPSGFAIMALWFVGGVCALCGAFSYAELGAALPRSGGEYNFLGRIYHPSVGFLAGFISATVGFAAPVAATAFAFGSYFHGAFPDLGSPALLSLLVVLIATLPLLWDLKFGSVFQDGMTFLKIGLVLVIIVAGCFVKNPQPAVSLCFVMYAYSGWNASTYIVGELRDPSRAIPLSVGLGTLLVMGLYLAVNAVFLHSAPAVEIGKDPGNLPVALVAGGYLFGPGGAKIMALFICVGLISMVSSMMWIGPRVTMTMGEDLRALGWLARKNERGIPITAILVQCAIAIVLLLASKFDEVVNYIQFSLTLCSTLVVLGVYVLRWRQPELPRPYRAWGYPVTPAIFLAISGWMMWFMLKDAGTRGPSLWGFATIFLGLLIYFISPKNSSNASFINAPNET
jgi:basic amino acid/polyamine antiporter, APA family